MTEETYDIVVLGGGAGGVPAAIRAAQLGGRVAIVEAKDFGGQCMNRGCIPFGHMMVASNMVGSLSSLGRDMGLAFTGISKDYSTLKKRQDELIGFMRKSVRGLLAKNKVMILEGTGKITAKDTVEVNGKMISYKKIILATGARWQTPEFPGAELEEVINTDDLLTAAKLPKRLLLFGRSPWLIEIAQFLKRFDAQVILAMEDKDLLPYESRAISSRLRRVLKNDGIEIKAQAEISGVIKKKDGLHVELNSKEGPEETLVVDKILTLQRAAALKGLGLASINLDEDKEYLTVTSSMETETSGVYAIGDLTGPPSRHYSHLAFQGGIIASEHAMGKDASLNPRTITRILFTQPQVACVGLTPREAKAEGYDVLTGSAPCSMNPFGMILSENEGIVEVVAEKNYGELLGIHLMGTAASEMAAVAVLAIQMEATLEELAKIPFPHPTLSESLAEAAGDALGKPIYLP